MLITDIPTKFQIPFANGAQAGFITVPIPTPSQPNGRASLTDGFSQLNFDPIASGGIPPWGRDFNGLMNMVTNWLRWAAAGGPITYDATFAAGIGGYPQGAVLLVAGTKDRFWISTIDNNMSNPDAGGANWIAFPDVITQAQAGNIANDTGAVNAYAITLTPAVTDWSKIIGAPLRFFAGHANTIQTPTLSVNGLSGKIMINTDGSALSVPQISRAGQFVEGFYDGTFVQITSPGKTSAAPSTGFPPGTMAPFGGETPPTGWLECDGTQYLITAYPNLYLAIGNRWGGDGVNNFRVPDLRGAFIRGWDHGRGLDPNATTRTASPLGSVTVVGDHVGSWETDAVDPTALNGSTLTIIGNKDPTAPLGDRVLPLKQWLSGQYGGALPPGPPLNPPSLAPTDDLGTTAAGGQTGIGEGTQAPGTNQSLSKAYAIQGNAAFTNVSSSETRPVNADCMYIIAY